MRVLVAEDDDALGAVLVRGLREQGYVVDLVPDGTTAVSYSRVYQYEVAVIDWRMPELSGLDAGADDYLVKPFDFGELLARLRALQRRPADVRTPRLILGELELDPATRVVRFGGREPSLAGAGVRIETVRGVGYRIVAA
jgi:DNA-binding response OmpR family regulator